MKQKNNNTNNNNNNKSKGNGNNKKATTSTTTKGYDNKRKHPAITLSYHAIRTLSEVRGCLVQVKVVHVVARKGHTVGRDTRFTARQK
jgi:hypothetical protein